MDFDEDKETKSIYNEGLLQIQRLGNSWAKCNHYSSNGLMTKWRWELDVVWRELSYDNFKLQKSKDLKEFWGGDSIKTMKELDVKVNKAFLSDNRYDIYSLLSEKEVTLRILQHKVGKGGKYEDDDAKDIE